MREVEVSPAEAGLAVILAAGEGSRLAADGGRPKPLTPVLGLSLGERVVCGYLRGLGVRRFLVVLGHAAEAVRAHFTDIARRRGVEIEFVTAEDWRLGNGASALAARGRTGEGPFHLAMCDHLFDPEIAAALARQVPGPGEVRLAVDRDKAGLFDVADATRVRLEAGRIVEIGKGLARWDAADVGLLLCTPALFDGLERAAAEGRHGLADGVAVLAADGRAGAVDVTGLSWLDVDTPAALREAESRLFRREAGKAGDGPVSRYLNRPVSRLLSRRLVRWPVTPNQISVAAWLLACLAAVLFALGGYPQLAIAGVIAQAASIIDGCDGEVARLKEMECSFGGWFDAVLDRYADAFLLFGLTWHVFAPSGDPAVLTVGFAAILGSFMNSYTADKYDRLMARRIRAGSGLRIGRDVRVLLIAVGAILDLPFQTLGLIAVVMNLEVMRRIYLCRPGAAV